MKKILFYKANEAYGVLGNFDRHHPVTIDGKTWPSTEHYFQAQKFAGTEYEEKVRLCQKPMDAAIMGRDKTLPLRADWLTVRDNVMLTALRAKFTQYAELKDLLLKTGNAELVEHTSNDAYWADGPDGKGQNKLGQLLMQLRTELQA